MKTRKDEIYERGFKDGKDGTFLDDVANGLAPRTSRDDEIYQKGYAEGQENRPGLWEEGSSDSTSSDGSGSGCFITTACMRAMGRTDSCRELSVLRAYRDSYLLRQEDGRQAVEQYYQIAPRIVAAIERLPEQARVFREIYQNLVWPAVTMVENGRNAEAFSHYKGQVLRLARLLIEESD